MDEIRKNDQTDKPAQSLAQPQVETPALKLLAKDVSRKEFLSILGFGGVALIGIAPIIHFFTGKSNKTVSHIYRNAGSTTGYSSGRYNR